MDTDGIPVGFSADTFAALQRDMAVLANESVEAGLFNDPVSAVRAITEDVGNEVNILVSEVGLAAAFSNVSGLTLAALNRVRNHYRERLNGAAGMN